MKKLLIFAILVLSSLTVFPQNGYDRHGITVFPNPSVDGIMNLKIDCDFICEFKIYNITGDNVYEKKLSGKRQTVKLNLSGLSSGVYIMVLYHSKFKVYHRLKFVIAKPSLDKK